MKQLNRILQATKRLVATHRTIFAWSGVGVVALLMIAQFIYPSSHLPLFAKVDGVALGGWSKANAIDRLNALSREQRVTVQLGESKTTELTVKADDIGITVSHAERINNSRYPWYLRIIPSSLFWFGPFQSEKPATVTTNKAKATSFITKQLGKSCKVAPKNASLKLSGSRLVVVPAKNGGSCEKEDALSRLLAVKPVINQRTAVTIPVDVLKPAVGDAAAETLARKLNSATERGVEIAGVANESVNVPQKEILGWLTFTTEGSSLQYSIDSSKAKPFFDKSITPKVAKPAGVTRVSTLDFTETSRVSGANGQTLDLSATVTTVKAVLESKQAQAKAVVAPLAPKVEYTRSYTKTSTGIAATLEHFAKDTPGTYGVSFNEIGGRGLSANYNSSESFITASTYKLFVAYSVLKRIDAGKWKLTDEVTGGKNVSTCFDDMIVKSDNPCAEAMYKKIGYQTVINEARALGLSNTTLSSDGQRTSAGDLALYLNKLESKQIGLTEESRTRLLSAMKRNVYRSGIPAGASGTVADKVGFLYGLLHDASIVYSPKGAYVLVVMTDGSTWGNIAELTRKIEALR